MKTNKMMRNIMPSEWNDFFTIGSKDGGWGRWFKDGDYRTCAYSPERKTEKVVQAAPRRQKGKERLAFKENKREMFDKIFGYEDWAVNIIFITTGLWQGVWVYDRKALDKKGLLKVTTDRNEHPYFEIPLHECHKICDIWNIFYFCSQKEIYHVARSQYEYLMKNHPIENYTDWRDIPNWCLWKYFSPWNRCLRLETEEEFLEYIKHARELPSYVPAEVNGNDLPHYDE